MILLQLFIEFFKIGLFAVGGGMATIPFLQELSQRTGWFSERFITDMIAISESTPGPIGINMATYVGFNLAGVAGGIVATLGTIIPAIVIITLVSKSLEKFSGNKYVDYMFYGLRPAVTGLIAAAGFDVFRIAVVHIGEAMPSFSVFCTDSVPHKEVQEAPDSLHSRLRRRRHRRRAALHVARRDAISPAARCRRGGESRF